MCMECFIVSDLRQQHSCQCQARWWPGDDRHQAISGHDIDPVAMTTQSQLCAKPFDPCFLQYVRDLHHC